MIKVRQIPKTTSNGRSCRVEVILVVEDKKKKMKKEKENINNSLCQLNIKQVKKKALGQKGCDSVGR